MVEGTSFMAKKTNSFCLVHASNIKQYKSFIASEYSILDLIRITFVSTSDTEYIEVKAISDETLLKSF